MLITAFKDQILRVDLQATFRRHRSATVMSTIFVPSQRTCIESHACLTSGRRRFNVSGCLGHVGDTDKNSKLNADLRQVRSGVTEQRQRSHQLEQFDVASTLNPVQYSQGLAG